MNGQEERDMLFARLFGFMSVIRSGLLVRTAPLATSASSKTESSSSPSFKQVIEELIALGDKKSWLRESAWFTIGLAIDALDGSEVAWKEESVDFLLDQLFVSITLWSPEKFALTLKLQDLYPERDWSKLVAPTFKNPNLLSSSNLQTLSRILKVINANRLCALLYINFCPVGIIHRRGRAQGSVQSSQWYMEASITFCMGCHPRTATPRTKQYQKAAKRLSSRILQSGRGR